MTFDKILLEAPELVYLMWEGYNLKNCPWEIKNKYWYKLMKPRMEKLVGFYCDDPALSTTEAYDLVYHFFINLMEL